MCFSSKTLLTVPLFPPLSNKGKQPCLPFCRAPVNVNTSPLCPTVCRLAQHFALRTPASNVCISFKFLLCALVLRHCLRFLSSPPPLSNKGKQPWLPFCRAPVNVDMSPLCPTVCRLAQHFAVPTPASNVCTPLVRNFCCNKYAFHIIFEVDLTICE